MRRVLLGALVALCACGGGSGSSAPDGGTLNTVDNAPPFVGTWTGTLTQTETAPSAGQSIAASISFTITETAVNTLKLGNVCGDGSGPSATVTSSTQFGGTAPFACPAIVVEACSSIIITFSNITGTLSGTELTFGGDATYS